MVALLVTMLMVPDLTNNISLLGALFFVYNVFTALQDVSTDALAVDVLQSHEFERVNSYMFTAKSLGGIIGGAGLGTIIGVVGIRGAFLIQIPILVAIMMVPLFMRERPGEKRFPWDEGDAGGRSTTPRKSPRKFETLASFWATSERPFPFAQPNSESWSASSFPSPSFSFPFFHCSSSKNWVGPKKSSTPPRAASSLW
jgi:hypothetical protein